MKTQPSELVHRLCKDLNLSVDQEIAICEWLMINNVFIITKEDMHDALANAISL